MSDWKRRIDGLLDTCNGLALKDFRGNRSLSYYLVRQSVCGNVDEFMVSSMTLIPKRKKDVLRRILLYSIGVFSIPKDVVI